MKLTSLEKEIMKIIWEDEKLFFRDIMGELSSKYAPTTVATVLKRLYRKKIISYCVFGNSRQYYAILLKEQYLISELKTYINLFYNGSLSNFCSFINKHKKSLEK